MSTVRARALVQPALVVRDLDEAVDRCHELFGAVPSERSDSADFENAVYAFGNVTFLELLTGLHEGHTRQRFLQKHGPGMYMFCVDVQDEDPERIEADLRARGIRIVALGRRTENVLAGWHLHPQDACGILMLLALKRNPDDNADWAGRAWRAYVRGNTRHVDQLRGVLIQSADWEQLGPCFGRVGMPMEQSHSAGQFVWAGPTGTRVELGPHGSWGSRPPDPSRRDYSLLFAAREPQAAIERLSRAGLEGNSQINGRWVSDIDSVLGVRVAIEPA